MKNIITILIIAFFQTFMAMAGSLPGKEPHESLVDKIILALQKEDPELFIKTCVPDQKNFDKIIKAQSGVNPEIIKKTNPVEARDTIINGLKRNFISLINKGKEEGIKWSEIKHSWTGSQSTLMEEVYQLQIPFHFTFNNKEYRIEIDYCTQLEKDPKIILLGEFKWIGPNK